MIILQSRDSCWNPFRSSPNDTLLAELLADPGLLLLLLFLDCSFYLIWSSSLEISLSDSHESVLNNFLLFKAVVCLRKPKSVVFLHLMSFEYFSFIK